MLRKNLRQYIKQKVNACNDDRPLSKMQKEKNLLQLQKVILPMTGFDR